MVMRMAAIAVIVLSMGARAEEKVVKEMIHGVEVSDPYRWLEGDAQGKATPEVKKWTEEQNARTRAMLDSLPGRAKLESRLREVMQMKAIRAPEMAANRYFYTKREGTQNQAVLYVREGFDGAPRELLDANKLDKEGLITLSWYEASQDGKVLAFGIFRSGDENSVLHLMDVQSGKWMADEIEGKVTEAHWMPDGAGFVYRKLADVKNPYSGQIRFHRVGQHAREDALLFEQYKEGPLATTWGPDAWTGRDGKWLALSYATSTKANDLWAVDMDRWKRTGEFVMQEITKGADAKFGGPILGDVLYMQTTLDAPNGRVVMVDMNRPGKEFWKEIIRERKDAVIEGVQLARGMVVVRYQRKAATRIELFDLGGKSLRELALPGIGSASLSTNEDRTEAFLTYTSFN